MGAMFYSCGVNENDWTMQARGSGKKEQRLLVAVSPSQISEQLVHWAHRLASALDCCWGAVYVETPAVLSMEDQLQLSRTLALARTLGADVITTTDPDVVHGLLRTVSERGVTQIILGKPVGGSFQRFFRNDRWIDRLLQESGELRS